MAEVAVFCIRMGMVHGLSISSPCTTTVRLTSGVKSVASIDHLANPVAERSSGRPAPQASKTSLLSIGIRDLAPTELAFPTANGSAPLATSVANGLAEARISRFIETGAAAPGSFLARARPITPVHSPVLAVSSWAVRPSPIAHNHAVGT